MEAKHKDVTKIVKADEIEALFVQTSHGMSYDDGRPPCAPWPPPPCSSLTGPTG